MLACSFDLGKVGSTPVSRHLLLAYDDIFSIEYFRSKLPAYWRRNGMKFSIVLSLLAFLAAPSLAADAPKSLDAILAASPASDWQALDPRNTLYMDLPAGRVVVELAPEFAPQTGKMGIDQVFGYLEAAAANLAQELRSRANVACVPHQ